jgi:hypothetical protein
MLARKPILRAHFALIADKCRVWLPGPIREFFVLWHAAAVLSAMNLTPPHRLDRTSFAAGAPIR